MQIAAKDADVVLRRRCAPEAAARLWPDATILARREVHPDRRDGRRAVAQSPHRCADQRPMRDYAAGQLVTAARATPRTPRACAGTVAAREGLQPRLRYLDDGRGAQRRQSSIRSRLGRETLAKRLPGECDCRRRWRGCSELDVRRTARAASAGIPRSLSDGRDGRRHAAGRRCGRGGARELAVTDRRRGGVASRAADHRRWLLRLLSGRAARRRTGRPQAVCVIGNDGAWGTELHGQLHAIKRSVNTELGFLRYDFVGQGFGCHGEDSSRSPRSSMRR